jgi:hypothetical protein
MARRYTPLATACGLSLTVALSACGSSSSASPSSTKTTATTAASARAAALNCLRQHGVTPGATTAPSQQALQAARQACQQYFRGAFPRRALTPAQRAQLRAQTAAVRSCLASHGYTLPAAPAGPPGLRRGGGAGFGALQRALTTPAGRKAVTACASVIAKLRRPGGGFFAGPGAGGPPGGGG